MARRGILRTSSDLLRQYATHCAAQQRLGLSRHHLEIPRDGQRQFYQRTVKEGISNVTGLLKVAAQQEAGDTTDRLNVPLAGYTSTA